MSKAERDRAKAMQEKFQAVLSNMLKDEDNKYCVDCDAKGPRWASWNLGVFLCIRCAGIHRKLGVHISKVKSVNLDTWLPEQLAMLQEMGNSRARAVYEANLPDNFRRPQTDSALEAFIRAKYEQKKYIAREWVPPQPKIPKEWVEDERDKKKSRPKTGGGSSQIQLNVTPSASKPASAAPTPTASETKTSGGSAPAPAAAPAAAAPKPVAAAPAPSASADLMGLEFHTPKPQVQPNATAQTAVPNGGDNLLADIFGGPPAPAANGQPSAQSGEDLFVEGSKVPEKSAKDSIMALFGSGQQQQPQMFGVPDSPGGSSGQELMLFTPTQPAMVWPPMSSCNFLGYGHPNFPYFSQAPGGMYMPQQNMGMYGNMPMATQPAMAPQAMAPSTMAQQGMPQQGMPQQGMPQQGMRMQYPNMMPMQQPQQQAGMYGMGPMPGQMPGMPAGNMMMQGNMMYGQQPPQQQMQFQQMQQQMGAMKIAGAGGPQPGGGGWGAQGSGQTLSTNLWQ